MISENSINISEMIHRAVISSATSEGENTLQPLDLKNYLETCHEFLKITPLLPESLLQERLTYLEDNSKLKMHFPAGKKCCVTIIPCTNGGFPLTDEEIKAGAYLNQLIVDENGITISGFSFDPSKIFQILPDRLRTELTFQIPNYQNPDLFSILPKERAQILAEYERVYRLAQKIFDSLE
jgi:hypothetical protein